VTPEQAPSTDVSYPCPVCSNTMVPGATYADHRAVKTRGVGRVWELSGGAPALVECSRCEGTGVLDNRRIRLDRRQQTERRA
jgi:hypothetical protein